MNLWLLLVLMSLAVYRGTRLLVEDTFPPVLWVRDRLVGGWRATTLKEQHHERFPTGDVTEGALVNVRGLGMFTMVDGEVQVYRRKAGWVPFWVSSLLSCPYCASGWIALVVVVGVWWWLGLVLPLVVLMWVASWALGGMLAAQEWA